jgi:hypothetical protein
MSTSACAEPLGAVMNFDAAKLAVPRSLHAVVAKVDDETIGMGRIVGDGMIFFYLQDIAVVPKWQGRGVGAAILSTLLDWVRKVAPEKSFLGVFAVKGTETLYERYGFSVHPSDVGMFQVVPPNRSGGTRGGPYAPKLGSDLEWMKSGGCMRKMTASERAEFVPTSRR